MNLCSPRDINNLLARHGFRFSKSLGQNFLIADWVPERIARESGASEDSGVLEIGPGAGCLTRRLSEVSGQVVAVERDRSLLPVLEETVGDLSNVTVLCGDIMKLNPRDIISEHFRGLTPRVCANLPYNITTPVLTKILTSGLFSSVTVMVQREVAERVAAAPGTAQYGAFSVLCQYYAVPSVLFYVPPECFMPRPAVVSAVIRLDTRPAPPVRVDETLFFRIVRGAFNQRRKTLVNARSSALAPDVTKDQILKSVTECGLPGDVRGERLSIEDFARIAERL